MAYAGAKHSGQSGARTTWPLSLFSHHGIWGVGVKLFRALGFKSKALAVSIAFVVPLAILLAYYVNAQTDLRTATQQELQGVTYVRPVLAWIKLAQQRRDAAVLGQDAALDDLQRQTAAAMAQIESQHAALGSGLHDEEPYAKFKELGDALQAKPVQSRPELTYRAHAEALSAALELSTDVVNTSGLILDPEAESYHLINMAMVFGPRQTENTAKLKTAGMMALASGQLSPSLHDEITTLSATQRFIDGFCEQSYLNGVANLTDEVKLPLGMKENDEAFDAFNQAMSAQISDDGLTGKPETYAALGAATIEHQNVMNGKVFDRVGQLLEARVAHINSSLILQVGMVFGFLSVAGYLFYSFYLVTRGGFVEVKRHLVAITDGDLTTNPNPWGKDEAAELMLSLKQMQNSLHGIVDRVRESSASLVKASGEIASASMDLSARTEQSAANLQETAAAMHEISATVKNTASNVQEASQAASSNSLAATRGGNVIAEVVNTMQDINTSSKKISEIIGTIDGIAFQTNILALNAAVEVARAGEQGRGFAVVASEVRNLATRSAQAAKEIKGLIAASVEKVESGTRVVMGAGDTMKEIQVNAKRMNDLFSEIATAATEQSDGVGQVGSAVGDLDRMTQQNAALVEQTAAAATELRSQAEGLAEDVARFKLPA